MSASVCIYIAPGVDLLSSGRTVCFTNVPAFRAGRAAGPHIITAPGAQSLCNSPAPLAMAAERHEEEGRRNCCNQCHQPIWHGDDEEAPEPRLHRRPSLVAPVVVMVT